jgi:hypothetical protein
MRQQQFESAVARATGESLRTIQSRGFSLVRLNASDRSSCGKNRSSRPLGEQDRSIGVNDHDFSINSEI